MGSYSCFLKFGDVAGDVREPAYRSWIEVFLLSQVSSNPGSDIVCRKRPDSASGALYQYCASGKTVDAVIDIVRKSGGVHYRSVMSQARITSFQWSDESEGLTIGFEKIERKIEPGTPPP